MTHFISFHTYLTYLVSSVILLVIPGPTVLTVIGYSLGCEGRVAPVLVAAVALGDASALSMSLLGLGALLAVSAMWFSAIKLIGGLYLLFLGAGLLRSGIRPDQGAVPARSASRRRLFADTYLVTALNPKSILFFVAFLPQFVQANGHVALQLWLLAVSFVVLAAINAAMYSIFASSARRALNSPRTKRYLDLMGGSLLSVAGLWVLLVRRPV